ncbi:hypothetical protein AeRB84_016622 [Aphanomyces euteiches]|nr:hypothetical protein AeRB84_016622 [Aphanomyces euteiches]
MTPLEANHLSKWFRRQRVEKFQCLHGDWEYIDDETRQSFYQSMFNCPTLQTLKLTRCFLGDINFIELAFTMKNLVFNHCYMTSEQVQGMAKRLQGSKLTRLELNDFPFDDMNGIESLFQVQPCTSIKSLTLNGLRLKNPRWCNFITPLIEKCTLETLVLYATKFPSDAARSAKESNNDQSDSDNSQCYIEIAMPDLQFLIESMMNSSRQVKVKRIKWTTEDEPTTIQSEALQALIKLTTDCGGEFIHETTVVPV